MVKQAPKCKIGFPCGKSCINRTKNCYANLSTKDNKVAETFSQFINRLVGIGNDTQSELNIPEETKAEIAKNPREELLNNVTKKEINSIIKSAKEEYPIDSQDVKKMAGSFKKGNKFNKGLAAVIQNYTFEGYVDINDYLRGKKLTKNVFDPSVKKLVSKELIDEDPETKEIAAKIKAMDLAYGELNDLKEDTKVYRGLGINSPGELSNIINLKPGDTFKDPAFVSTSPDKSIAEMFSDGNEGGILLEINLNKGFKNAKDIADINEFGEKEILINRGTKFKVESVEEITIGNGETRKLIKLSPIEDNNSTNEPFDINQELKDERRR